MQDGFEKVWYNRASKFWRAKDFAPEGCRVCKHFDYCTGACPLYWDVHGFDEIKDYWPKKSRFGSKLDEIRLNLRRRIRGDQHGIT